MWGSVGFFCLYRSDADVRPVKHADSGFLLSEVRGVGFKVLAVQGAEIDSSTPGGSLIFGIFAALAEFERDLIHERVPATAAAALPKRCLPPSAGLRRWQWEIRRPRSAPSAGRSVSRTKPSISTSRLTASSDPTASNFSAERNRSGEFSPYGDSGTRGPVEPIRALIQRAKSKMGRSRCDNGPGSARPARSPR